jgi:hypothetical protein
MRADDQLGAKSISVTEIAVLPEKVVSLVDKDLLDLRMKMSLGLLDKDEMQRLNLMRDVGALEQACFFDTHPFVAKAHQHEHHRDQILIAEAGIIFWERERSGAVARWVGDLILHRGAMP